MIILGNLFIRPEDVFCGKTSTFNLISTMSLVIQGRFDSVHKKSLQSSQSYLKTLGWQKPPKHT